MEQIPSDNDLFVKKKLKCILFDYDLLVKNWNINLFEYELLVKKNGIDSV